MSCSVIRGGWKKVNDCGIADIIRIRNDKPKSPDGKNLHDTSKPVPLMRLLIEQSSNEGDIVLDPFMGIGTTALAAKECGRHFIGYEISEQYHRIANERLEQHIQERQLF
ncbi:MAG: site-specific DNA-methyltransferase [Bacteroidaceae bacterium]|nr:site-specific DNA-methyltransferase [Bacteroidaceae bacterium]